MVHWYCYTDFTYGPEWRLIIIYCSEVRFESWHQSNAVFNSSYFIIIHIISQDFQKAVKSIILIFQNNENVKLNDEN